MTDTATPMEHEERADHTGMVYVLRRIEGQTQTVVGVFATLRDLEQRIVIETMTRPTGVYASEAVAFYGDADAITPANGQAVTP